MVAIASGQRWREKGEEKGKVTWMIVSISSDQRTIGLTGPGPCRSMKYVTPEELEEGWEQVS